MILGTRTTATTTTADGKVLVVRRPGDDLRAGDLLDDRFEVTAEMCRGGMATIFKARDLRDHDEPVVLKIPHKSVEMDQNLFNRFEREEQVGLRLSHPSVLKFIPVTGNKSRPYLVTEYLRGVTLLQLLGSFRIFPEADALAIASRICEALEYVHAMGVIHRDLKPENIMICADGSIRLMDFGICRAADSRRITFIGFAPGTPHYMAPERVEHRRGDARSDVYSLGAILYEMLTGTIAFNDEDLQAILDARVTGDPVAPRKLNPRISPQAEEIVLRAMERNPSRRYPTAAALQADLDAPQNVRVTGRCERLRPSTKFRRTLRIARKAAYWCLVPILAQIIAFFIIWHFVGRK